MSKINLNPIASGYRSMQQSNADMATIQAAIDNTLSRDGTSPNQMGAPLDMNGYPLINLGYPASPTSPIRLQDYQSLSAIVQSILSANVPSTVGPISVRTFGAQGDGITNDTTSILNTCSFVSTLGGGIVRIPTGSYLVNPLTIPSNVILSGDGPSSVLKLAPGSNFRSVININGVSNVYVRDLQIDGNGSNQSSGEQNHGILIYDASNISIDNISVHDCQGDGITAYSSTNSILVNTISIRNNRLWNLGRQGICLAGYGAKQVIISGNIVRQGTLVSTSTSRGNSIHLECDIIPTTRIGDINIVNNVLSDTGISVGGMWSNVTITDNTLDNMSQNLINAAWCIAVVGVSKTIISNNTMVGDGVSVADGIFVEDAGFGSGGSATVIDIVITGNNISNLGGHGLNIIPVVPALGRFTIADNIIQNIGIGAVKNGLYVEAAAPGLVISSNSITNVTGLPISLNACADFLVSTNHIVDGALGYGIYCAGSSGPGLIIGNRINYTSIGTTTQGITIANEAGNTGISIVGNDLSRTALSVNIAGGVNNASWNNRTGSNAPIGSFTLTTTASTTISNNCVIGLAHIALRPINAAAATLMGSAKMLFVSAKVAGTSFTVTTANGAAAAGTETFEYEIIV